MMDKSLVTQRINTYFAVLLVTAAGCAAALLIVHTVQTADRWTLQAYATTK